MLIGFVQEMPELREGNQKYYYYHNRNISYCNPAMLYMFIHIQVEKPACGEEGSSRKYSIICCYFILRGITS